MKKNNIILHITCKKIDLSCPCCPLLSCNWISAITKKNVFWCIEGKELIKKGLLPKKKILQEKRFFFNAKNFFFVSDSRLCCDGIIVIESGFLIIVLNVLPLPTTTTTSKILWMCFFLFLQKKIWEFLIMLTKMHEFSPYLPIARYFSTKIFSERERKKIKIFISYSLQKKFFLTIATYYKLFFP